MYRFLKSYVQENFAVKIFLLFTLVILAMSFITASLFIHHEKKVLWNHLVHQGKLVTNMLAYNSRLGVFSETEEMLENVSGSALNQEHVLAVVVYNKKLEKLIVKTKHPQPERIKKLLNASKSIDFMKTKEKILRFETKNDFTFWAPVYFRPPYMDVIPPLQKEMRANRKKNIIGYVSILVSKKKLNDHMSLLVITSAGMAVLFWLSGSGLMLALVKGITDPLFQLTKAVNRMRQTGHLEKINIESKDEIGKLSKAFNQMSEAIKQREREKSKVEEQLRQAQKMEAIGNLAGGIAHDFNNILGAIHGFTELGLLEAKQGTVLYEKLKEIDFATTRAADLVTRILTFSRQTDESLNPIQVGTIAKEVFKLLSPSLPPNVQISQNIDPNSGLVLSNTATIHQIIMNLCANALHAMKKKGGKLTVILKDVNLTQDPNAHKAGYYSGWYQRLTVKDTGHGIPEEIRKQIFDPFFTTKRGEGTGMGLSVVHGIVKRHKGFIQVESSPGKGSIFHIYLPLADLDTIPQVPTKEADLPLGREHILLVDDDEQLLESTGGMLKSLGYRVEKKTKSKEALKYFRTNYKNIDLVITDMAMAELNGVGLAAEIQHHCSNFPLILTTGYSEMMDKEKAKEFGFKGFLLKPVKRRTLAVMIKEVLAQTNL